MVTIRAHDSDGKARARRRLTKVASLALGLAMFGTVGLSGTLAQDDAAVGTADAESIVNSIIEQVFAEIFGAGVVVDDATVSSDGDMNLGGSTGSTVTMGGGGGVTMGGGSSGGGVTVGDDSGG
jgi:hypothetical protein